MTTQHAIAVAGNSGLTGTVAKLLAVNGDTVLYTADTITELTNAKNHYRCTYGETAVISGNYMQLLFSSAGILLARNDVTFTGADGETATESGGGTDEILAAINTYIDGALATVNGTVATIVGFPSSLVTGDSYTSDGGNSITVFIRDSNDDPITSVGTHEFTDPDFECDLVITSSGNAGRVRATVTYVDPGSGESYLRVEIPLSESRRAAPGTATMQCVLKWDGCQKTIATQTVTWVPRI
jgi:hypothetical protein